MNRGKLRVGVIGLGGIGRTILRLAATWPAIEIAAVLLRRPDAAGGWLPDSVRVAGDAVALLEAGCDIVAECAGHEAVAGHVPTLLGAGIDCVIASVGALADPALEQALAGAAARGKARLIIPAGAVGGIDLLAAARLDGLARVTYRSRKPPAAWRGSPAERAIDLEAITTPTTFFRGTARQAARDYPKNANVAATVALGGVGFDRTEVELIAVPGNRENQHAITLEGAFGRAAIEIAGNPLPDNPRTSYLAALSLMRVLVNEAARIVV